MLIKQKIYLMKIIEFGAHNSTENMRITSHSLLKQIVCYSSVKPKFCESNNGVS